ncbi:MAG: 30S ribosomal protein S17 [Chloroflexi bacterium]|nr:30S ribosomal protein S17 [Chloroflexota bacterium]
MNNRNRLVGKVTSAKMTKTVVVEISSAKRHPLYGKVVRTSHRFKAHDENSICKVGDLVEIVESKPISKDKRWVVARIVTKNLGVELVEA